MLYTKRIDTITWNDIDDFCRQGNAENTYLDYKQDFPSHLERTISAMANTLGGIVLIGVEEDDAKKPKLPLIGIENQRGLSEKVQSIILSNVTPPVFPEIAVCNNDAQDRSIIVIRIPQSHQSPHAIANNSAVYLRTAEMNKPEELATLDQISWLFDHRARSITLRNNLLQCAHNRYLAFYYRILNSVRTTADISFYQNGFLTLTACPTFPAHEFKNPSELAQIYKRISVDDYYRTTEKFPPRDRLSETGRGSLVQDGIVFASYVGNERNFHTEMNSKGLYFYRQPISRDNVNINGLSHTFLLGTEVFARIDEFIDSAYKFFQDLGFWGFINFTVSLTDIHDLGFWLNWLQSDFYDSPRGLSPDDEVNVENTILVSSLEEEKDRLLFESMQKLCWTFDIEFSPDFVAPLYKKLGKVLHEKSEL